MTCQRCHGSLWVCEEHPWRPWEGENACDCGAAGMPCPICNTAEPPQMPDGFKADLDEDGSRH
jgi:hypothetical protein